MRSSATFPRIGGGARLAQLAHKRWLVVMRCHRGIQICGSAPCTHRDADFVPPTEPLRYQ